jgi:hypothetical protein
VQVSPCISMVIQALPSRQCSIRRLDQKIERETLTGTPGTVRSRYLQLYARMLTARSGSGYQEPLHTLDLFAAQVPRHIRVRSLVRLKALSLWGNRGFCITRACSSTDPSW